MKDMLPNLNSVKKIQLQHKWAEGVKRFDTYKIKTVAETLAHRNHEATYESVERRALRRPNYDTQNLMAKTKK